MLKENVGRALNNQIAKEIYSSQLYLAMASWADKNGYSGSAKFLYEQAEEERLHMLKLFHYTNERGGHAIVTASEAPPAEFNSVSEVFKQVLEHEQYITESINDLVGVCIDEKDFTTNSFMQWFVNEQIEEEANAQKILDRLNLLGDDRARMYIFDRDMEKFRQANAPAPQRNM